MVSSCNRFKMFSFQLTKAVLVSIRASCPIGQEAFQVAPLMSKNRHCGKATLISNLNYLKYLLELWNEHKCVTNEQEALSY